MIKKVYVPLDGSEVADAAVRPGAELALRAGVPVVLVAARWPNARESTMQSYLDAHVAFLDGPVESWVIVDQEPADAIIGLAGESGAAVCMSTHGRGAFRATLLGSVAEAVVRSASGALLLVGPGASSGWTIADRPSILVGVDGSTAARKAALAACGLAGAIDASVELTHVFDPIYDQRRHVPTNIARTLSAVAGLADEIEERGIEVEATPVEGFDPSPLLIRRQRDRGHSFLAVGSHGRTGIARFALGSVSSAVVRHSPVPVLVTGPQWSESA
jgi:nucleotide-binding universal stress UspA family protein